MDLSGYGLRRAEEHGLGSMMRLEDMRTGRRAIIFIILRCS